MYTGKPLDSNTGLYYFGARFYDPVTGRFITEDSQMGSPSDPQSMNRYVYADNNPLCVVDPTGHVWIPPPTHAQSNNANANNPVDNFLSWCVSGVTNAWDSLPSPVQQGIIIGATVALTVATDGAAAPLAADAIETEVAVDATVDVAGTAAVDAGGEAAAEAGSEAVATTSTESAADTISQSSLTQLEEGGSELPGVPGQSASDTWANPETLYDHTLWHGPEFGTVNQEEYAGMANSFLRRAITDQLPMKIDWDNNVQYAFDPMSREFGVYNLQGETYTYHLAGLRYFLNQPGFMPW